MFITWIATLLTSPHAITFDGWVWLLILVPLALVITGLISVLAAVFGILDGFVGVWTRR